MRFLVFVVVIMAAPLFAEEPLNCLDHRSTVPVFINEVQKFIVGESEFIRNQVASGATDVFQIQPVAEAFNEMAEEAIRMMEKYESELFAYCREIDP